MWGRIIKFETVFLIELVSSQTCPEKKKFILDRSDLDRLYKIYSLSAYLLFQSVLTKEQKWVSCG